MKRVVLAGVVFSAALLGAARADVSGYRHRLDFAVQGYAGKTVLKNFPLLVWLYDGIDGFSYDGFLSPDGADLRFTLADGTPLRHQIEKWDVSGTSFVWVKVPSFEQGLNLSMYWGKSGDTAPAGNVFDEAGLWTALHLAEKDGAYADATGQGNGAVDAPATLDGVTHTPRSVDGLIGDGVRLSTAAQNAKSPSIRIASYAESGISDTFSFSLWFRYAVPGQLPADDCLIGSDNCRVELYWGQPTLIKILDPGCGWISRNAGACFTSVNGGAWQHLAVSFSGSTAEIYVNGVRKLTAPLAGPMAETKKALGIGNDHANARPGLKGDIDEFRLYAGVVSADWISAEYAMAAPGERFLTLYNRKIRVVPPGTPGVDPAPPYDTWQTAATNLAAAIAAADALTVVAVHPGTYEIAQTLQILDGIVVRSEDPATGRRACERTVIDASKMAVPDQAVKMTGAGVLDGLTIRGGGTPSHRGGAVSVSANKTARLQNCRFIGNVAEYGGAVYLERPSLCTVSNCLFLANSAKQGGGVYYLGAAADADRPLFSDCTFLTNRTMASWAHGPALYAGQARLTGCRFDGNEAFDENAYSSCLYVVGDLVLERCRFRRHAGTLYGASCLYVGSDVRVTLTGCTFDANEGKCVYTKSGIMVENSVFTNNAGDAVAGWGTLRGCLIADNGGVGVFVNQPNTVTFVDQCTIVQNGSYAAQGNADNAHVVVRNALFYGNGRSLGAPYDYATWKTGDFLYATNSVISARLLAKDDPARCRNVWAADPLFADAPGGDWHLRKRSPYRDAGEILDWMTDRSVDLDGRARQLDAQGAASLSAAPDLGCFEAFYPVTNLRVFIR